MRTLQVFRAVLRNRDLRRVELAYTAFNVAEYAVWIAMLVFAYGRGGTTEASLVAVLQLAPAAICAPFLALLADRHRPVRALIGGYLAQAAGLGVTAAAIVAGAPVFVIYAGAVVASAAMTISRPAQAVIVPSLARSAEELTATNVVSSWVESCAALLASALTGILLTVAGVDLVFGLTAALVLGAALLLAGVEGPEPVALDEAGGAVSEALGGFGALAEHPHLRLLLGLLMAEFVLWGAMDILFVVLAIDVLELGRGWVGYLNAAFGVGGIAGGFAAVMLVGRRHLAPPIAAGMVVFGGAFVVIALWPSTFAALLLLALGGAGRLLFDVGCRTLLQRTTPAAVLGRVFGLLEGLEMASLALGALLIPPLVALGGSKAALIGSGLLLPVIVILVARPLVGVDRRAKVPLVEIALLRSMALFAPLPAPAIEGVAHALEPLAFPAGTVVLHAGDEGDRFYAIADGEVAVSRDGRPVARLARGAGFGEIALLEDVPRTATVTAITDVRLYALEKGPFVTAVTGHAPAAAAAGALVSARREELARLAGDAPSP
jgi:Cyclic nucleotide-binding domain/Major Facilitator Superfamily